VPYVRKCNSFIKTIENERKNTSLVDLDIGIVDNRSNNWYAYKSKIMALQNKDHSSNEKDK
jgi:hypothetical protein